MLAQTGLASFSFAHLFGQWNSPFKTNDKEKQFISIYFNQLKVIKFGYQKMELEEKDSKQTIWTACLRENFVI